MRNIKNLQFASTKINDVTQWTANYNQVSMNLFIKCVHVHSNRIKWKNAWRRILFGQLAHREDPHNWLLCRYNSDWGSISQCSAHQIWSTICDAETEHIHRSIRWWTLANVEKSTYFLQTTMISMQLIQANAKYWWINKDSAIQFIGQFLLYTLRVSFGKCSASFRRFMRGIAMATSLLWLVHNVLASMSFSICWCARFFLRVATKRTVLVRCVMRALSMYWWAVGGRLARIRLQSVNTVAEMGNYIMWRADEPG